ncbi:hypothetical protein [Phytohabitans rumicis]|uniref:hypothetical protein n=1 Tax=Phytohabitans rumicis TaxID=1076125 RepID=UPI001567507C|nr:hypothetical protein [Phytohabitans rumicis]
MPVTPGGPAVSLATTRPGQVAEATFAGTVGQRVSVVVSGADVVEGEEAASYLASVISAAGVTLDSGSTDATTDWLLGPVTLAADGVVTVRFDPAGLAVGSVLVRVHDVSADVTGTATIGGGAFAVTLPTPGVSAAIDFPASAGQPIVLDMRSGPSTLAAVIRNPAGAVLCSGTLSVSTELTCTAAEAGSHRLTLTGTSAAIGEWSLELIDGLGTPTITVLGAAAPENWLNDGDVNASWSTEATVPIAGYAVVVDTAPLTDPGAAATQTSASLAVTLADGSHYLHVRAIATSGFASPVAHRLIKVDATAPVVASIVVPSHPDPDTPVADLAVHAQFTVEPDVSGVAEYAVSVTHGADDEPLGVADSGASYTTLLTGEGEWYLHVVAVDAAGNRSAPAHRKITADTPPSAPLITSPTHPQPGTAYPGRDLVAVWEGGAAWADSWAVLLDDHPDTVPGTATTTPETRFGAHLDAGTWWLHVRGIDASGTAGATAHFRVVVAPQATAFTAPRAGSTVWGAVAVTVDCPGSAGPLTIQARTGGGEWRAVGAAPAGDGTCEVAWHTPGAAAGWADGAYELRALDGTDVVAGPVAVTLANAADPLARLAADYRAGLLGVVDYVRYSLFAVVNVEAVPARYRDGAPAITDTGSVLDSLIGLWSMLPADVQAELSGWLSPTASDPPASGKSPSALQLDNPDCDFWTRIGSKLFSCRVWTEHFTIYYFADNVGPTTGTNVRPDYIQKLMVTLEGARAIYSGSLAYRVPDHVEVAVTPGMPSGLSVPSFPGCRCGDGLMYLAEDYSDIKSLARHELFHFVQYEYMNHLRAANYWTGWWMEATAEWGAHISGFLAGEGGLDNQYYQSLGEFLTESDERFDEGDTVAQGGGPEYGAFIVAEFLETRLDPHAIRWSWERLGGLLPPRPGEVIKELLEEKRIDGNFAEEIERFRQWAYVIDANQSPVGFYDDDADKWEDSLTPALPDERPPHDAFEINDNGAHVQTEHGEFDIQQTGAHYVQINNPKGYAADLQVTFAADDADIRGSVIRLDASGAPSAACGGAVGIDRSNGPIIELTATCPQAVITFVNAEEAGRWGTWTDGDYTIGYVRQSRILSNGSVELGMGRYGNITSATGVGLRQAGHPETESVLNGCWCEGWGVGIPGGVGASVTDYTGVKNLTIDEFTYTSNIISSKMTGPGGLAVLQTTAASTSPYLFELRITVYNTNAAAIGPVHYRRAVDWDPLPNLFQSYNTVQTLGGDTSYIGGITNDGFADPDPSYPLTDLGATGWFTDFGPDDTGALIDINLGTIEPGAGKLFSVFYGTAPSETAAIAAAQMVGAQVYSLGEVDTDEGRDSGLPYTAVMAIDGRYLLSPTPPMGVSRLGADQPAPEPLMTSEPGTRIEQGGA